MQLLYRFSWALANGYDSHIGNPTVLWTVPPLLLTHFTYTAHTESFFISRFCPFQSLLFTESSFHWVHDGRADEWGYPHMGWCSVERLHEKWHLASHKGGGRGRGRERGIQLGNVRRGKVLGWGGVVLDNSLFCTVGGGGGQRHRQVGVIGHLTVEEW